MTAKLLSVGPWTVVRPSTMALITSLCPQTHFSVDLAPAFLATVSAQPKRRHAGSVRQQLHHLFGAERSGCHQVLRQRDQRDGVQAARDSGCSCATKEMPCGRIISAAVRTAVSPRHHLFGPAEGPGAPHLRDMASSLLLCCLVILVYTAVPPRQHHFGRAHGRAASSSCISVAVGRTAAPAPPSPIRGCRAGPGRARQPTLQGHQGVRRPSGAGAGTAVARV